MSASQSLGAMPHTIRTATRSCAWRQGVAQETGAVYYDPEIDPRSASSCRPAPMRQSSVRQTRLCTGRGGAPSILTKPSRTFLRPYGASGAECALDAPNDLVVGAVLALRRLLHSFVLLDNPTQSARCLRFVLAPAINSPNPVLLCVGQLRATRVQLDPNTSATRMANHDHRRQWRVSKEFPVVVLQDSITLANVAGFPRR